MSVDAARAERIVRGMLARDAFSRWLGIELLDVAEGSCRIRMRVREEMQNGFGVCHGGVVFALADSALAFASNGCGRVTVSIENSISYPVTVAIDDILTAEAEELSVGRRVAFYNVTVTRADGVRVALFRGTVYRTRRPHETTGVDPGAGGQE